MRKVRLAADFLAYGRGATPRLVNQWMVSSVREIGSSQSDGSNG